MNIITDDRPTTMWARVALIAITKLGENSLAVFWDQYIRMPSAVKFEQLRS